MERDLPACHRTRGYARMHAGNTVAASEHLVQVMEKIKPLLTEAVFSSAELIIKQGDPGDAMYLLCLLRSTHPLCHLTHISFTE